MRWEGQVERLGELKNAYKILVGRPEGRNDMKDLGIGRRIILKWILRNGLVGCGLD
jgi:hypothetical protein